MAKKTVITAAITGGIHTPSMSPYLPVTVKEIVEDAVKAHEAGAAVVHIHAREPDTGKPSSDLDLMEQIITGIKSRCDAIICITTGGGLGMTLEERLAAVPKFKPELASCNAGSVNFVLAPAAEKIKEWKHDWEKPYLEGTSNFVFQNTFRGLEYYINTMISNGTRPEFEVYDSGMINNIAFFLRKGVVKRPIYIQFVLGVLGGLPGTVDNLTFMVRTAKDLLGSDINWSCCAAGKAQFPMTATAAAMGGNVRVGLEDNLYIRPHVLAKASAEQVENIRSIVEGMGLEIANSAEAREKLGLKGIDSVAF